MTNMNANITATVLTSAITKRVHGKTCDWACTSYKVELNDGEVREVSEFFHVENAEKAVAKANRLAAKVGHEVELNVTGVQTNVRGNCAYKSIYGYAKA